MDFYGWHGKVLRVNLSAGEFTEEPVRSADLMEWIGGRGLAVRIAASEIPATPQLPGPDNKLIFAVGPLTGTGTPGAGRFCACARSPLTGTIFDSNAGGRWGVQFKKCGWDALIVEGESPSPVWIELTQGRVLFHDAGEIWGCDTHTTTRRLTAIAGSNAGVLAIGPAGENLVKYASITVDGYRALGRGGLGAVMGAKKLKAITASGTLKTKIANKEKFKLAVYEAGKWLKANPVTSKALPEFGTPVLVNLFNEMGVLPACNFRQSFFAGAPNVSGETLAETMYAGRQGCSSCPVRCAHLIRTAAGTSEGPEYESVWALGPACGIGDLNIIVEANRLCNRLGLDTISTGVTVSCAMELEEEGLGRFGLKFGDGASLLRTIEDIACRRGTGNLLANGSKYLAAECGAPHLAMQVKGLELPAYDPRGLVGMGLAFATSNRGGCHMRAYIAALEALGIPKKVDRLAPEGKAGLVINYQNISAAMDCLVVCRFINLAAAEEYFSRILSAVTGVGYQPQDLYRIGEKIWNAERLFNTRCGFSRRDDNLPPRLLKEPPPAASLEKTTDENLNNMLNEYYRFRGWDITGVPAQKKVRELGLEEILC